MLKCGLLGKKLGHSYSPWIHNRLGDYEYRLYEKKEDELSDFILYGDWDGLNVTIPYKKTVLACCNELSECASATGSVNTLIKKDGKIFGDNTDVFGFSCLLEKNGVKPSGKKALILGSGGASVSVRAVLENAGADTVIISRNGPDNYENIEKHFDAQLIVNTTPVGMYPENGTSPLSLEGFSNLEAVLDIIYNPARTALVMKAEDKGIKNDTGLYMLVAQALRSSELFTGNKLPVSKIDEIEHDLSSEMKNIVLVGMPGSGKSTIACILGKKTGREVLDLDEEIVRTTGYTPADFIEKFGESGFREAESETAAAAGKKSGMIISTGGGVVTVESNYKLLHQNGTIIWIRRNIDDLPLDNRPISKANGIKKLYEQRKPLYERFADLEVDNDSDPQETVLQIMKML